jgi:N-acetylneuraminate lyase
MMQTFHGTWPALITPVAPDGSVNVPVLRELTEYLLAKQVDGLYLCGSTGEGLFQSVQDRELVVKQVLDQVRGRIPVIVHVGCVATREAVALAQHAQRAGAVGVSSVLPLVATSLESTYLHYAAIAAAAPELDFYPYLFGGQTDAVSLMQGLLEQIPNVAGAKYTGPNMYELEHIVELGNDGWTIFSGMDEQCLYAAMSGAPANIGSTLNFMPGVYREIRKGYDSGNVARARELQLRANRVTRVVLSFGFPGALREVMRALGLDCGAPRLPNPPLPAEERERLHAELEAAGLAELAAL